MAKLIKQDKAAEQNKPIDNAEAAIDTAEMQATDKITNDSQIDNTTKEVKIPSHVDKILKMFPNYAQLAVDAQGGVYTEASQLLSNGKAILYQNPYYKQ